MLFEFPFLSLLFLAFNEYHFKTKNRNFLLNKCYIFKLSYSHQIQSDFEIYSSLKNINYLNIPNLLQRPIWSFELHLILDQSDYYNTYTNFAGAVLHSKTINLSLALPTVWK